METERVAKQVKLFGEKNCRGQSPLYEQLCLRLAEDRGLIEIVRATPDGQPVPNLILAAVHFLLLSGIEHDLMKYYPSCHETPQPASDAFDAFRSFCLDHEQPIRELLATRRVQTNEVRRCASLFPAFSWITGQHPAKPLAMIEIGCSAGLLLNWDRYDYRYGEEQQSNDLDSPVLIQSEWRGERRPNWSTNLPSIVSRVGIDLHVVDLTDSIETMWLKSLIWPDQLDRMKLLDAAVEQFIKSPVSLLEGDAINLLPTLLKTVPESACVCVLHSHTLNQFSFEQREQFDSLLLEFSRHRTLVQLSVEWIYTPQTQLEVVYWERGQSLKTHLANVDHHGRWIEWLL